MPPPPLWSLGYHQCRWFDYTQDAVEELGRAAPRRRHPVRRPVARHRVHGRLPRLHLEHRHVPRRARHAGSAWPSKGFRVITIIDPGVKCDPGYAVFDQAVERDVLCRTEGGDIYIGQVWPGNTAFPDFVTEEARDVVGRAQRRARAVRAGRHLERHERARHRRHRARARCASAAGEYSHERYHNQYALLMAMGTTAGLLAAMPELRTFVLSRAGFAGIQRYAANWMGDNLSRWDHLWLSIADGDRASASPARRSSAPTSAASQGNSNAELFLRWMQYGALTPFCRNHSEIGNVDQYAWAWGDGGRGHRPRGDRAALPAAALPLRRVPHGRGDRRAGAAAAGLRPPVRRRRCATSTTSTCFGPDLLVAPVIDAGHDRAPGLPAGRRLVRLAHRRRWLGGGRVRRSPDADGADPDLRPRRRGDPDVARGAGRRPRATTRR